MTSVGPADASQAVSQRIISRTRTQIHDEDTEKRRKRKEKAEWITRNIKMRKCSYYIASTKRKSEGMCQCGYPKQDHDKAAIDRPKQEQPKQDLKRRTATLQWTFEQHSDSSAPTNAFGEIEFVGFIGNNAQFVRVDSKTNIAKMLKLMIDVWELEKPNLLISVIGGTENFNMTPHLRDLFRFGLVNAARNLDAWIITGGTHVGVAKYVGEAVKYSRLNSQKQKDIVAIGIAPWGVIHNKHLLVNEKSEPIQYTIEDKPIEHERFLNPNHSHFILVDNGTQHQFETETTLRAELESTTCKKYDFNLIPAALLVIDGGPRILKTVKDALSNNIPVVIVKGSGRVADLLAYAFKNAEESVSIDKDDKGNAISKTKKRLKKNQRSYMYKEMKCTKFCETKDIHNNMKEIEACLDKFELINIFELGGGDQDLDNTIFNAVLKANESDLVEQLRVALTWNLIDFARSDILTADKRLEPGRLDDIMVSAIQSDNVDFVELLLDNGVNIETFLTTGTLMKLYNGERSSVSPFSDLLLDLRGKKKMESTKKINMEEVGKLITHLLDDYYLQQYSSNKGNHLPKNATFENPFLHLLIWAVLNNLQDMAKFFWRKGLDSIAAALLAHALFSAMKSQIKNASPNLYEDIEANSREFMGLATGVVEQFYRTYENYAHDLLIGELSNWEKASCILIAMKTNNETFISATPCQEVFNNVWMGEMTQENSILKLLICIFIPPLIPLCVKFKENTYNEPDPGDDITTSDTVQEDQATEVASPNVSLQQSDPSLQSKEIQDDSGDDFGDDVGDETNHDSEEGSRQETKDDLGDETKLKKYFRRAKENIQLFYRAPVVNFLLHVISYMAFLCLYSYILISKFDQNFSVEDVILIVWVAQIFIEEISQVIATRYIYTEIKLKAYIADFWNIADILMILLFVIGIILKLFSNQETLEAARVVLGVNLITFFLRLLQIFSLNKELGPKLVMIIRMVRNLTSFFVMLLIFIVAYAIASHAILYPNTEISFNLLRVIFRRPYWNVYGELMLDEIEGTNDCTNILELYRNGAQPRCPTESGKYVVPVLMGVYMLMCNILLLNLLISIFSNTYQMVQENADMHWRVQRYHQIQEYITRPMFVPIYSFIVDVFRIILFFKRCLCRCKPENDTSGTNVFFQPFSDDDTRDNVREWERSIAQDCINSKQADLESIDNSVKAINKRLDKMDSKIDALQEQQHTGTATIEEARLYRGQTEYPAESESIIVDEPGPVTSDQRMDNIEKKLQRVFDALKEYKLGAEQASPEKTDERVEGEKKADLESIDHSVKAITLRLDQLFSKIDALQEQQHALPATIENARLHPSQTDCEAKSEFNTVDETGSVNLDQRMNNREEQIPWIDHIPEEHQPGAE